MIKAGFILWGLVILLAGCATPARQTEALLRSRPNVPVRAEVAGVPYIHQESDYCGPASLAMLMQWNHLPMDQDQVAREVYTPGMKGTFQSDLIGASRRHGLMAVPITGMEALLREIAAGHPVIVFENLALSWYPQWHYAVVLGYDLDREEVIMHSGPEAFKHWAMRKFERSWMLADYWGLVVLPAGELAVTANELTQAGAAAGLEQTGQTKAARKAYGAILSRWPQSLPALIGLGNLSYAGSDYSGAVTYLRRATEIHPEAAAAWHNLALAEGAAKMSSQAHESALKAVEKAPASQKEEYRKNLSEWL